MAARTVADLLATTDDTLNDVGRKRYPALKRIDYLRDAIYTIKSQRPDLFLGSKATALVEDLIVDENSAIPLDPRYFRPLADYVIARCETKDAEHVISARVELFAKFFGALL